MLKRFVSQLAAICNEGTRRHLEWIFRITTRRPLTVITASLLAVFCSAAVICTITFDNDIFQLFPRRQPALRLMLDTLEWTGSANEAYFLVEGERKTVPLTAQKLATRLQQLEIEGKPAFKRVTWQIYDQSQAQSFTDFVAYAALRPQLFIAPQDASRLMEKLSPSAIDSSLARMTADLAGQFGSAAVGLAAADPLYLRELILPRLKSGTQALDLDPDSPYFLSRDGQVLIMIAEPSRPIQDMVFARRLVAGINEARRGLPPGISCAGAHISAVLDEAAMKSNILACILSSLVVVLALFYATYRRILPTLLLPLIIASGVALALGLAGLLLPSIHIISFAFMALIIGLGTDYSIHLYDRFHTERVAGRESLEALRLAVVDTGHGLFTAATTTAVPFLALGLADVRALSELGLLVGLGVIFSLYTTLFFLPPLLIFMEQRFPISYRPIPSLGLMSVWRFTGRSPGSVVIVSLAALAALTFFSFRTTFDGNLKNLQPQNSEAFLAQDKIERHLSLSPKQLLVAIDGPDLADVLRLSARVETLVDDLQRRGEITVWSGLGRVINSQATQVEVISAFSALISAKTAAKNLNAGLSRHGFDVDLFRTYSDGIASLENARPILESEVLQRLSASPLRGVVDRHLAHDANGYHALTYLYYTGNEFDRDAFLVRLAALEPSSRTSSVELISEQLSRSVKTSFTWGFVLGGILVVCLLVAHFESMAGIFYALFPVAAGVSAMLGSMVLFGMGINFMNAMVLVTIVGMGSDYGLHLCHRINSADAGEQEEQYIQAGRAVLLSALTTIAGFGSLAFADYPALASIGWATNFGIGFTALITLVTIPAVMASRRRLKTKE